MKRYNLSNMTAKEIRETVSPMVIWMADAAIREAINSITGNTRWADIKRSPYNLPEVEMAGRILFKMFSTCEANIKSALIKMTKERSVISDFRNFNFFDEFVISLDNEVGYVTLRKPDWVLDLC